MCRSKVQGVNGKSVTMITRINEAKTLVKHIPCGCKCKFDIRARNNIENGIMKHVNVNVKTIKRAKNITVEIPLHVFVRIVSI